VKVRVPQLEQRVQALSEKVEKLDRIVYRLWKDLKALVNDTYRQKEAE
jgi:archaellum component FlaC